MDKPLILQVFLNLLHKKCIIEHHIHILMLAKDGKHLCLYPSSDGDSSLTKEYCPIKSKM